MVSSRKHQNAGLVVCLIVGLVLGFVLGMAFPDQPGEELQTIRSIDARLERIQAEYQKWKVHHEMMWQKTLEKYDPEKYQEETKRLIREEGQ